MMSQIISLRFKYTPDEFKEAIILHRKKTPRSKAFRLFTGIMFVLFFVIIMFHFIQFFLYGTINSGFLNWFIATFCIFLFVFIVTRIFSPQRMFRRTPRLQQEFTFEFSEKKVYFKTEYSESDLQWSTYTSVLENEKLYLLMQDKNLFTIIPKRVFDSKEQESSFRQLLTSKQLLHSS